MERRRTTRKSKTPHGENPGSSPLKHGIRGRPSWIRKARPPAALQKRAEREQKRAERELVLESLFVVAGRQESRKVLHQGIRGSGPEKRTRPLWLWPGTFSFFFF